MTTARTQFSVPWLPNGRWGLLARKRAAGVTSVVYYFAGGLAALFGGHTLYVGREKERGYANYYGIRYANYCARAQLSSWEEGGWWLVACGWWLVAGGWWLVAGGWWEEWGTLERPEKKGVPPTIIRGPLRAAESAAVPVSSLWLQGNVASLQGSPRLFVSVVQITGEVKQITQK